MNFSRNRIRRQPFHLDLTAMIDVVFQVVLFLILSTTFKKDDSNGADEGPGIQVDLPKTSSATVFAEKRDVNVWMSADGSLYLDGQPTSSDSLKRAFKRAARANPSTIVIIKADKAVPHGHVVSVMDMARMEGLSRLAIRTSQEDEHTL